MNHRHLVAAVALSLGLLVPEQAPGAFEPNWDSLRGYRCPEWFRDVKFGIFLHYGLNTVPGFDGHYARHMYWQERPEPVKGTGWTEVSPKVYAHHVETYGHPTKFGYKDFLPMWKAEKFDASALARFFQSIGAKYVVPVAVHCDNFDNWNSVHHRWNSVDKGPGIDFVGEWKKACREHGLYFGVSSHFNDGHENVFFQGGADTTGPLAGVPYDTQDPRYLDFYHRRTPDRRKILPEFGARFLERHLQLIDGYEPDLLYFDGGLPYGENGLRVGAHFLNMNLERHGGKENGVLNLKRGFPKGAATLDIEKGQADRLFEEPWQTDTTINPGWFFLGDVEEPGVVDGDISSREEKRKVGGIGLRMDAGQIVDNLVDIVSKNGNLLLNVGQREDGSIPQVYRDELEKVGRWLEVNGEAIYGTRPWLEYGEGPTQIETGYDTEPLDPWRAEDIRFTTRGDVLHAITLAWPEGGSFTVKSLSDAQPELGEIGSIQLLGSDERIGWRRDGEGLTIEAPPEPSGSYAHVFRITPAEGTDAPPAGRGFHVSVHGDDAHDGSADHPLRTISAAARRATPGDVITVHEGVYRERVDPPRGGTSDARRITYQAAPGEEVVLKGSELVKGWQRAENETWVVTVPNDLFGDFNPYGDEIHGDWFAPRGRSHHTGAVYLDDHWLIEAATLEDVLQPIGQAASSYAPGGADPYLLNVAWLRPPGASEDTGRRQATSFAAQRGVQAAPSSEGGECIGWIEPGDWVRYEGVDLGSGEGQMELRVASATRGGLVEIRLDAPDGDLLGACAVPHTGGWQAWTSVHATLEAPGGVRTICLVFRAIPSEASSDVRLWFARVDPTDTTIWAQFDEVDPNEAQVEINVRRAVFYPERPGIDYLTVRGFTMMHAATPWAPPTAEQIGLLGTHWSKGWIIENNDVRYSVCTGITLGKHGDEFDNTSQNSAEGYVETIERAHRHGWSKENIGHHVVRDNHISHCEQAGIVGSMGPVFCAVTGNVIHDIHVRRLFSGAEMAAIKFHGAIDTVISHNHIHHACRGIWLDWMTQGTRVTRNLVHDISPSEDLFVEVNHGPFLVDNNFFLSPHGILVNSQGGAYAHNLVAGSVRVMHGEGRQTPYHEAHSTEVVGLQANPSGDDRYYNNIFVSGGLASYDPATLPVFMGGNVFLGEAQPSKHESSSLVMSEADPGLELIERPDGLYLHLALDASWTLGSPRQLVTTDLLGKALIPDLPYEQPDGSPYAIDTDYLGRERRAAHPFPGPIEPTAGDGQEWRVWAAD